MNYWARIKSVLEWGRRWIWIPVLGLGGLSVAAFIWLCRRRGLSLMRGTAALAFLFAALLFLPLLMAAAREAAPEAPVMIWSLRHILELPGFLRREVEYLAYVALGTLRFVLVPLSLALAAAFAGWPVRVTRPVRGAILTGWGLVMTAGLSGAVSSLSGRPELSGGRLGNGLAAAAGVFGGHWGAVVVFTGALLVIGLRFLDIPLRSVWDRGSRATLSAVATTDCLVVAASAWARSLVAAPARRGLSLVRGAPARGLAVLREAVRSDIRPVETAFETTGPTLAKDGIEILAERLAQSRRARNTPRREV